MTTHNIYFHEEIKKNISTFFVGKKNTLPRAMHKLCQRMTVTITLNIHTDRHKQTL